MIDISENRINTLSTTLILPMICERYKHYFFTGSTEYNTKTGKKGCDFINCYIKDENRQYYDNHIFLVYKTSLTNDFFKRERILIKLPNFVKVYEYIFDNNTVTVYCFSVPAEYQASYDAFKNGEYTKMQPDYKVEILRFWGLSCTGYTFDIVNGSNARIHPKKENLDYKVGEILHTPILENETIPEVETQTTVYSLDV